ncbi:unnamed protein product [Coffea canephora]|uniref:Uncharacterized protein n=1 Tax=Coffea canephora TaxID=49390 RepID=A0A068U8C2_COFCA|nr:unnamed protein product [Coffea canephora]
MTLKTRCREFSDFLTKKKNLVINSCHFEYFNDYYSHLLVIILIRENVHHGYNYVLFFMLITTWNQNLSCFISVPFD